MKAENLSFDDCSQREVVEEFGELFPYVGISVLSQTLIIETISIVIFE
jgi:hypothetical protein